MKKTNFDLYLEEQLKDPDFAERFERAGEAWDVVLQLAALREKAGLSQKDLARKLHTSQQNISRLESPSYEGHSLTILNPSLNPQLHPECARSRSIGACSRFIGVRGSTPCRAITLVKADQPFSVCLKSAAAYVVHHVRQRLLRGVPIRMAYGNLGRTAR
jgi:DNA-binding XRE family transcriptional regulator